MDNYYRMHKILKKKIFKYLVKMYWMPSKIKYKNVKYIYS